MTIEEKLNNFYKSSLDSARENAENMINEHESRLLSLFEDHKQTMQRQADAELKAEMDKLKREMNKQLSTEQMKIKRSLSKKNMELKNLLIEEVKEKLRAFKQTPAYETYLESKIKETLDFAAGDGLTIYINAPDVHLKDRLEAATGTVLAISEEDFKGGIRAVIPEKHILIDNSFLSMMKEEQEAFIFHGGMTNE